MSINGRQRKKMIKHTRKKKLWLGEMNIINTMISWGDFPAILYKFLGN